MEIRIDTLTHMQEDCDLARARIRAQWKKRFIQDGNSEERVFILMKQLDKILK